MISIRMNRYGDLALLGLLIVATAAFTRAEALAANLRQAAGMPPEPAGKMPALLRDLARASSGRVRGASLLRVARSNSPTAVAGFAPCRQRCSPGAGN